MHAGPLSFGPLALVAGCCGMCAETTRSENIRTEGMRAEVTAESRGDGRTRVTVQLRVGGVLSNVFPQLSTGDHLDAGNGAGTVPLAFSKGIIASPAYHGELPGDSSGRAVQIRFARTGNTSALGTRVVMPPAFAITAPAPGARLTAARNELELAWSPVAGAPVAWTVDGGCILGLHGDQPADTGSLRVSLTAAPPPDDGGPPRPRCDVTVKLERVAHGTLDPAFGEGGSISATQQRQLVVEFTP
jgi:hypothetical protein